MIATSNFDARPISCLNQEGERLGYEPDLARAVCDRLKLKPIWHNLSMADLYSSLQTGQYDCVWFNQAIYARTPNLGGFHSSLWTV